MNFRFFFLLSAGLMIPLIFLGEYREGVYKSGIRTPLCFPSGNPLGYPFLELNNQNPIEFHFDEMGEEMGSYFYAPIHCDHNWEPTGLTSSEYIRGFGQLDINSMDYSFNTQVDFVHYQFQFPNDMMKPTRSGNYAIIVFKDELEDPNNIILVFRVIVYESLVTIGGAMKNSSLVSERYKNQEIDFNVDYSNYSIFSPSQDVHVQILQNGNWNTAKKEVKPTFIKQNEMVFDLAEDGNFRGESEWRAFELKNIKFASLATEYIALEEGVYNAYLRTDEMYGVKAYQSQPDINGQVFIRNDLGDDSYLEADYVNVHFSLKSPRFPEGHIYLECRESRFNPELFELTYNEQKGLYEGVFSFKQGYYNYRYKVVDAYHPSGDISLTEGHHFETENDYHVFMYSFDRTLGHDRLVGVAAFNSAN
ncbi:MAG: DUF5103 domain-containing protein [Flavobacteriales bacterium]